MTVGIIVEEPSAVGFVKKIAEKLGIHLQIIVAKGREKLKTKLKAYAALLEGCEKIIALVDSHCSDPLEIEKTFRFTRNVEVCVIVHAIESWLLGDRNALAKILKDSQIRTPQNPETFCKPEEELAKLFQRHGKKYLKSRDARIIAEFIELEAVTNKCPSFQRFKTALLHC